MSDLWTEFAKVTMKWQRWTSESAAVKYFVTFKLQAATVEDLNGSAGKLWLCNLCIAETTSVTWGYNFNYYNMVHKYNFTLHFVWYNNGGNMNRLHRARDCFVIYDATMCDTSPPFHSVFTYFFFTGNFSRYHLLFWALLSLFSIPLSPCMSSRPLCLNIAILSFCFFRGKAVRQCTPWFPKFLFCWIFSKAKCKFPTCVTVVWAEDKH